MKGLSSNEVYKAQAKQANFYDPNPLPATPNTSPNASAVELNKVFKKETPGSSDKLIPNYSNKQAVVPRGRGNLEFPDTSLTTLHEEESDSREHSDSCETRPSEKAQPPPFNESNRLPPEPGRNPFERREERASSSLQILSVVDPEDPLTINVNLNPEDNPVADPADEEKDVWGRLDLK